MRRARMSCEPPAAMGTTKRTGRNGYACAQATREKTGSALAPTVRRRNCRRGSFIAPSLKYGRTVGSSASLRLDVCGPDDVASLLGFLCEEFLEVGGRTSKYVATQFGHPRLHHWISEGRVDLSVDPFDDLGRGALGHANTKPTGHLVAWNNIADHWDVWQHRQTRCRRHSKRAQPTRLDVRQRCSNCIEHRMRVARH